MDRPDRRFPAARPDRMPCTGSPGTTWRARTVRCGPAPSSLRWARPTLRWGSRPLKHVIDLEPRPPEDPRRPRTRRPQRQMGRHAV